MHTKTEQKKQNSFSAISQLVSTSFQCCFLHMTADMFSFSRHPFRPAWATGMLSIRFWLANSKIQMKKKTKQNKTMNTFMCYWARLQIEPIPHSCKLKHTWKTDSFDAIRRIFPLLFRSHFVGLSHNRRSYGKRNTWSCYSMRSALNFILKWLLLWVIYSLWSAPFFCSIEKKR